MSAPSGGRRGRKGKGRAGSEFKPLDLGHGQGSRQEGTGGQVAWALQVTLRIVDVTLRRPCREVTGSALKVNKGESVGVRGVDGQAAGRRAGARAGLLQGCG